MRDGGTASRAAGAVARSPDDLAKKGCTSENTIADQLRLVNRAMIQVKPHRALCRQAFPDHSNAGLQPWEICFDRRPSIFVRDLSPGTPAASRSPRAEGCSDIERRIQVSDLRRAGGDVAGESRCVRVHQQIIRPCRHGPSSGRIRSSARSSSLSSSGGRSYASQGRRGPAGSQPVAVSSGEHAVRT